MPQVLETQEFITTCGRCRSKLSYRYSEITDHEVNHDYLGDYDVVDGIKCPVCNSVIRHLRGNIKG